MTKRKSDIIHNLDSFARAYLEAALWSSNDESDENGGAPLDQNYEESDIAMDSLKRMINDCQNFQKTNTDLLAQHNDMSQAGHDFWLTRNGHGAGFWDRGLGELGEKLTAACESFGTCNLYVARGKIHVD